jgi:hypothetical protein
MLLGYPIVAAAGSFFPNLLFHSLAADSVYGKVSLIATFSERAGFIFVLKMN